VGRPNKLKPLLYQTLLNPTQAQRLATPGASLRDPISRLGLARGATQSLLLFMHSQERTGAIGVWRLSPALYMSSCCCVDHARMRCAAGPTRFPCYPITLFVCLFVCFLFVCLCKGYTNLFVVDCARTLCAAVLVCAGVPHVHIHSLRCLYLFVRVFHMFTYN
jgi:hypothetical protein